LDKQRKEQPKAKIKYFVKVKVLTVDPSKEMKNK
jgi:hypothetical protein